MKYNEWIEIWLKMKESKAKTSTIANYKTLAITQIMPLLGELEIEEINEDVLQDAVENWESEGNHKTGGNLSEKSVREILRVAKSSITAYYKKNKMPVPSFEGLELQKSVGHKHEVFTNEEQKRILKGVLHEHKSKAAGIGLGLLCGMRIGEICALKWDSVNMDDNLINVEATIQRIYMPDDNSVKKSQILIDTPKTENSRRKIPMSTTVKNMLTAIQPEGCKGLYVVSGSEKPIETRSLRNYYYRFLERNSIRRHTFHDLRHTFGTKCITCGIDPATVCKMMGHANPTITINLYCHPQIEDMQKAMDVLDDKWLK